MTKISVFSDKKRTFTLRDHPFKTSAFLMAGTVKNLPNLLMDSSKKLPTVGGVGVKNREKYVEVINGWSLNPVKFGFTL